MFERLHEMTTELKRLGLWKKEQPGWVSNYHPLDAAEVDFFEWLQFVYIPNKMNAESKEAFPRRLVMTTARPYVSQCREYEGIMRLMIEIDGL